MIDRERLFSYSRGIKERKERQHETELLAGPERGLLLNLAQQMVLYLCGNPPAVCDWYWGCGLELGVSQYK